jgi:hypothetical protein
MSDVPDEPDVSDGEGDDAVLGGGDEPDGGGRIDHDRDPDETAAQVADPSVQTWHVHGEGGSGWRDGENFATTDVGAREPRGGGGSGSPVGRGDAADEGGGAQASRDGPEGP